MSTIEATRCGVAGWITRIFPIFVLNCWYCSKNIDEYLLYKKESPNAVMHFSDVGGSITGGGKQAHANHRTHQSPFYNNLFIFFLLSSLCILSFYFCLFLFVFEEIMNGRRPPSEQWLPRWQSVIPAPLYFSSSHLCTSLYFSSPDLCYSVYFSYLQFLSFYLFTSHHLIFVLFALFTSISLLLSSVCLFVSLIFASFFLYYSLPHFSHLCISVFHTSILCTFHIPIFFTLSFWSHHRESVAWWNWRSPTCNKNERESPDTEPWALKSASLHPAPMPMAGLHGPFLVLRSWFLHNCSKMYMFWDLGILRAGMHHVHGSRGEKW